MECLKAFRLEKGLSIPEIAKAIGVSASFYDKVEKGERTISRGFMQKFKVKFPSFDMNIFFDELLHESCNKSA